MRTYHGHVLVGFELPLEDLLVLVEYDGELLVEFGHELFGQLVPSEVGGHFHKRHLAVAEVSRVPLKLCRQLTTLSIAETLRV